MLRESLLVAPSPPLAVLRESDHGEFQASFGLDKVGVEWDDISLQSGADGEKSERYISGRLKAIDPSFPEANRSTGGCECIGPRGALFATALEFG